MIPGPSPERLVAEIISFKITDLRLSHGIQGFKGLNKLVQMVPSICGKEFFHLIRDLKLTSLFTRGYDFWSPEEVVT